VTYKDLILCSILANVVRGLETGISNFLADDAAKQFRFGCIIMQGEKYQEAFKTVNYN